MAKKHILIVEDDYIDRAVLNKILSSDYDLLESENGIEALNILEKYQGEVSLILLDIQMPVMNGLDFLHHIKSNERYSAIPVIVTTLLGNKYDEMDALSHGAIDFISKPYMPRILMQRVKNMIQLQENQKALEESKRELEAALIRAEKANAAKSDFLANISHDIRTPMNAILGYTMLMKDGLEELHSPKLLEYREKMEQSGVLLLSIINNVLDMARIESGKVTLDEQYNKMGNIDEEIRVVFEMEAERKHIHFVSERNVQHEHIICDVTKIREILTNLVSNAIKYTPAGGNVTLRITEIPSGKPNYAKIKTEVIDDGIGMSEEYLQKIYEPFSRERNTTLGKVGGTGLGMSIVKSFVELMGGTIEVESKVGKGTKFTIVIEHQIADENVYEHKADVSEVSTETLKGRHILLAEDNELNAEIATEILVNMGIVVTHVEDGVQCVAKLQEEPAEAYDLILMDVQMPNMDGYQATRNIRAFEDKAKASIPIVAMTANAFEEDRKNSLEAGMNGHIVKPIDVTKLERTLLKLIK